MISLGTIFFVGYVLFAVAIIYTLLFGESDFHRRGFVGTQYQEFPCPFLRVFAFLRSPFAKIIFLGAFHRFITSGLWVQVKYVG